MGCKRMRRLLLLQKQFNLNKKSTFMSQFFADT